MYAVIAILMAQAVFAPGSAVQVQTAEGWVPGKVAGVERDESEIEYKVTVKDGNFTFDRYFPAAKVRAVAHAAPAEGSAPAYALEQAVEARDWSNRWRRGTVTAVQGSADTWRYTVKFADDASTTSFYADRIRKPTTAAAAAAPAAADRRLVLGDYACTRWMGGGQAQPPVGTITLLAGGVYRWLDDGGSGRYAYEAATGAIRFLSGPIAAKLPRKVIYQRGRTASQIDLNFAYGVDWSCGRNL